MGEYFHYLCKLAETLASLGSARAGFTHFIKRQVHRIDFQHDFWIQRHVYLLFDTRGILASLGTHSESLYNNRYSAHRACEVGIFYVTHFNLPRWITYFIVSSRKTVNLR